MKKSVNATLTVLSAVFATVMLTACPQSKLPDVPSTAPQPKALVQLQQQALEI